MDVFGLLRASAKEKADHDGVTGVIMVSDLQTKQMVTVRAAIVQEACEANGNKPLYIFHYRVDGDITSYETVRNMFLPVVRIMK